MRKFPPLPVATAAPCPFKSRCLQGVRFRPGGLPSLADMSTQKLSVLDLCVKRSGFLRGAQLGEFVALWTIAASALGRDISIEDVSAWWGKGLPNRTAYRRLSRFKEAFPEFDTPQPLADLILAQVHDTLDRRDARDLAAAPLDFGPVAVA